MLNTSLNMMDLFPGEWSQVCPHMHEGAPINIDSRWLLELPPVTLRLLFIGKAQKAIYVYVCPYLSDGLLCPEASRIKGQLTVSVLCMHDRNTIDGLWIESARVVRALIGDGVKCCSCLKVCCVHLFTQS